MKQTIIPVSVVYKPTKAGEVKYQVEDSERYLYSVWDEEIAKKLKHRVACDVEVEESKDGKYLTIRKFYASGPGAEARQQRTTGTYPTKDGFKQVTPEPERVVQSEGVKPSKVSHSKENEKTAGSLVSYAKDMRDQDRIEDRKALSEYVLEVIEAYKLALEKL